MAHARINRDSQLIAAERIWRENGCIAAPSIVNYRHWVARFKQYCKIKNLDERTALTCAGVQKFSRWYSTRRRCNRRHAIDGARGALGSFAAALRTLGESVPPWVPRVEIRPTSPLQREFVAYQREVRGSPDSTLRQFLYHIELFDVFLSKKRIKLRKLQLTDTDAFLVLCRKRYALKTIAGLCSSLRAYLRFLHATGRLKSDLATLLVGPIIRPLERPHRTIPWSDVRRLLVAIDRRTRCGKRDYALLLMMSTYGLGAGEVIRLTLDDVHWQAMTLHIVRPKNGVEFMLPLMPAVAQALASYLRHGRPPHCSDRSVFVTMRAPHHRLADVVTLRHILHTAARRAGISAPFLGTHVFRHTHACRQLELGTPTKMIGDILGHRDPESTSAYLRVVTRDLRAIALPVPQ